MVGDFNSWWRLLVEGLPFIDTTDDFYERAVRNCYSALCHNSEGSGTFGCSLNIDDVGQVLIAYISLYTKPEIFSIDAKYVSSGGKYYGYYDEYNDRFDAYRIGLVQTLAAGTGKSVDFVNSVLSYCYWNSDGKVPSVSLVPPKYSVNTGRSISRVGVVNSVRPSFVPSVSRNYYQEFP
jgi:hypothetical protein